MKIGHHLNDPYFGCLIGASKAMRDIFTQIEQAAQSDLPVFTTGDTGTGKEKAAEAIHKYTENNEAPFIPFHCAGHTPEMLDSALFGHVKGAFTGAGSNREGAISRAEGGTLFLDEIGDMPKELQIKLLRFTEDYYYQPVGSDYFKKANIRIICATRRDLHHAIQNQEFREDLFYRLYVQPIHLPSLKERHDDIVDLCVFFAQSILSTPVTITSSAMNLVKNYSWPGNVRELKNTIETIIETKHCDTIQAHDFPVHIMEKSLLSKKPDEHLLSARMPLKQVEKTIIENTIRHCEGDIVRAAHILEVAPSTLYRKRAQWKESEAF